MRVIETLRSWEDHGETCHRVLSRSEFDPQGPLELKRVLRQFVRVSPVLNLSAGGQVIGTTAEHPFWVQGRGWLPAGELKAGDRLALHDGDWLRVDGVADSGRVETVYNVEVEQDHTYYVGSDEWGFAVWVHNADLYRFVSKAEFDDALNSQALRPGPNSLQTKLLFRNKESAIAQGLSQFRAGWVDEIYILVVSVKKGSLGRLTRMQFDKKVGAAGGWGVAVDPSRLQFFNSRITSIWGFPVKVIPS